MYVDGWKRAVQEGGQTANGRDLLGRNMTPQAPATQVCKDTGEGRVPVCMPVCATGPAKTTC